MAVGRRVRYTHHSPDLPEPSWKPLTGLKAALMAPFKAEIEAEGLTVELVIDVVDGAPACMAYTVKPTNGSGLENRTTEVARGLSIRRLMADALYFSTWEAFDDPDAMGGLAGRPGAPLEVIEMVMGSVQRRRVPVTDERLREFADAYRTRWHPGSAAAFAESLHCSERQMYRLKKLAIARGFLKEDE